MGDSTQGREKIDGRQHGSIINPSRRRVAGPADNERHPDAALIEA